MYWQMLILLYVVCNATLLKKLVLFIIKFLTIADFLSVPWNFVKNDLLVLKILYFCV